MADRSYMLGTLDGRTRRPRFACRNANFGLCPMGSGLTRLETRYLGDAGEAQGGRGGQGPGARRADGRELGLVTFAPDDIDWEDEMRLAIEERAALSPDALTGMEASLRFAGRENMETRIFGRLTAWQNWIFHRPNAVGEQGALKVYGTGKKAKFDWNRV